MKNILLITLFSTVIIQIVSSSCSNPPPAPGYSIKTYQGQWYQVAKYQTAGGAFFQRNCTCTQILIHKLDSNIVNALQGCIRNGNKITVNASLLPTDTNGKYVEKIGPNSVGYWIIYLDEDYAVTYDCNTNLGITNYCIHVLSRKPHLQVDVINKLAQKALDLGLNKNNLDIQYTNQNDNICPRKNNQNSMKAFFDAHKKTILHRNK